MKRPSMQIYPADWQHNQKLRRLSWHLKGIWLETMFVLHDCDEYGVARFPLSELTLAVGCEKSDLRDLVRRDILKGNDKDTWVGPLVHTFSKGKRKDETVILLENEQGPIWFSSRMVRDNFIKTVRGNFGEESLKHPNVPKRRGDKDTLDDVPMDTLDRSPTTTATPTPTVTGDGKINSEVGGSGKGESNNPRRRWIAKLLKPFESDPLAVPKVLVNSLVKNGFDPHFVWCAIIETERAKNVKNKTAYLCKLLADPNWMFSDEVIREVKRRMNK